MTSFFRILLVLCLVVLMVPSQSAEAQWRKAKSAEAQSRKVKRAEAKAERQKEQQWNSVLESQKKDKKRRYEMQTSETKKRMKESKKKSKRINNQDREPFLKKLFHRKKR